MKKFYSLFSLVLLLFAGINNCFAQTALPVSRISWTAAPAGWTDNLSGTYVSVLACDGNSNRGKFGTNGDNTQVFFSGVPGALSFDLQGNGIGATSSLLVEESPDGIAWSTVATISGISGSCVTYNYTLICTSLYVRWVYTKVTGNLAIDNVSIATGSCGGGATTCPVLTGAILNGCDNGSTPCDEGQTEIMFFNSNSTSISVPTLNATHVINYYGSAANYASNTPDAFTGTFSSHAATTTALNALTGCSGVFIEAITVGTIPVNSTFIMLPYDFCTTNYDLSSICSSFSPIYVLYYGTSAAGTANGTWSTGGNLANYQAGANPKYIAANFSALGGCSKEYYTYDAGQENSGNGAGLYYPSTVSTTSASPTNQTAYTTNGCTLPIILPTQFLSFTAGKTATNTVELKWSTAQEINNDYFQLEFSTDAKFFTQVAKIKGAGNSSVIKEYHYNFNEQGTENFLCFRLKQIDFNGNYSYSKIIPAGTSLTLASSNNPVTTAYYNSDNEKITIKFKLDYPQNVNLTVLDLSGKIIYSLADQFMNEGNQEILLQSQGMKGVYVLQFQKGNNLPEHKKILISK